VMTVATLKGIDAEVIEFQVTEDSRIAGKTLAEIHFPKGGIIGTIIRGEEIIIPRGPDMILPGDEVIVFAVPETISEIEKFFE
jgi:trk system potassium uptake protein TrkA